MFTIDVAGRGFFGERPTTTAIRALGQSVAGHCRDSLFVAFIGADGDLCGCSVIVAYTELDARLIRSHVEKMAQNLGATRGMILDPVDPKGELPHAVCRLKAMSNGQSGFLASLEFLGLSKEGHTPEGSW